MSCTDCGLCKTRKHVVWGQGSKAHGLMLIGEAPGENEDDTGMPFVGKAGRELDQQYLRLFARVPRAQWFVTNVLKCRPPKNRDPKPEEVRACERHLLREIGRVKPKVIGALGRFATQWLLGADAELSTLHGIPQRTPMGGPVIVPCYHPAAGLHDPSSMIMIQRDFEALGQTVRGEITPEMWRDEYPEPEYTDAWAPYYDDAPYATRVDPIATTFCPRSMIDIIAADTETNPDGSAWSVQLTDRAGAGGFIPAKALDPRRLHNIDAAILILHNTVFDLPILRRHFSSLPAKTMDTMLMAYLLQDEPQGLKPLAYRHCGMLMREYEDVVREPQKAIAVRYLQQIGKVEWPLPEPVLVWKDDVPKLKKPWPIPRKAASALKSDNPYAAWMRVPLEEGRGLVQSRFGLMPTAGLRDVIPTSDAVDYACRDADATYRIFPKLWSRIKEHGLEEIFWIDSGIVDMLLDMMHYGMPIKREEFAKLSSEFGQSAAAVEAEIHKIIGEYVNPGSPAQVADLLFKRLGLRSKKKSKKTGQSSTDQKYLEQMRDQHEVVGKILEWRKYTKLKSTYADALPRMADSSGRIHPTILHTRTSTGRLATKAPNLQNQPVRTKEGRQIRNCFIAEDGMTFISCDYSQIELRTLAHESQDPTMLEAYRNDEDIHSKTASLVFGIPVDQLHPYEHRRPAKTCNFAVVYGITPPGLQDSLAREGADQSVWTLDRCEEFIAEWFRIYPGVKAYMQRQEEHARRHGYVRDMFGRIRRIPEVRSALDYVVSAGIREAGNMPIQSGAQGVMKIAMADMTEVYRSLLAQKWKLRPIMQIHDDLLWEVEEGRLGLFYQILKAVMENAVRLSVPVKVDGKSGKVWGDMHDIE